jgi:hypothetical protein
MYGKTTPRPSELSKVAYVLSTPLADLMAIYEGYDPQPPPLQDAIRELVAVLHPLVDQATDGVEARLRAVEAELESLRARRVDAAHEGRSVPDGTAGSGTSG